VLQFCRALKKRGAMGGGKGLAPTKPAEKRKYIFLMGVVHGEKFFNRKRSEGPG